MSTVAIIAISAAVLWGLFVLGGIGGYLERLADAGERIATELEAERIEREDLAARFAAGGDPA